MRRKLGQHFLKSRAAIKAVTDSLVPSDGATIVEIGPGKGALTEHLLKKGRPVVAIEKDETLIEVLRERFAEAIAAKQLLLHHGDVRDEEWSRLVAETPYIVIANIPYYLTGSLIKGMLTRTHAPDAMALVVQKEIAERITKKKNNKESLLSLSVRLFGTPTYTRTILRAAFTPQPRVDSALITITAIHTPDKQTQTAFFDILHTAFHGKRKTVLKKFAENNPVRTCLIKHGVTPTDRAEDIPFEAWLSAAREFHTTT